MLGLGTKLAMLGVQSTMPGLVCSSEQVPPAKTHELSVFAVEGTGNQHLAFEGDVYEGVRATIAHTLNSTASSPELYTKCELIEGFGRNVFLQHTTRAHMHPELGDIVLC